MDCSAIDCTPEDVSEEMGLSRKGDIYALKALCSKKNRAQDSLERENKKRKDSDDEVLMTNVFRPSTSNCQSSRTPQNKGKAWRNQLHAQLENERKLWRNLRKEQDEEFQKCLELDRKKQAALEGEIEELSKLEELRSIKAATVPTVWM